MSGVYDYFNQFGSLCDKCDEVLSIEVEKGRGHFLTGNRKMILFKKKIKNEMDMDGEKIPWR